MLGLGKQAIAPQVHAHTSEVSAPFTQGLGMLPIEGPQPQLVCTQEQAWC